MAWRDGEGLPWFKDLEERVDWKDFRYTVMRTHTWVKRDEHLFGLMDAFTAWRHGDSEQALIDLHRYHHGFLGKRMRELEMEYQNKEKEKKDENSNVLPFERPVPSRGGTGGGDDWLQTLPEGAVFLSRKRNDQSDKLDQWHITVKWKKGAILYTNSDRSEAYKTIDIGRFSRQNELVEVLRKGKMEIEND